MNTPTILFIADAKTQNGQILQSFLPELTGKATWLIGNSREEFPSDDQLSKVDAIVPVVFAGGNPAAMAELWPKCPRVRWVHSMAAGVDSVVPVMKELPRGLEVPLTNAKGAFSRSLAEYSLAAMLHFNKQIPRLQSNKRMKVWERFTMAELHGKTVGFVGFGDIAQNTARLCKAFGMRIMALRQTKGATGNEFADEVCYTDQDPVAAKHRIFSESDYVVCSLPGSPATYRFCGAAEFTAMKSTGVFISIGRGTCVDEEALTAALRGQIAGAALDVFDKEPLVPESPLWECDNLLLSPHNADLTIDYIRLTWDLFRQKLTQFCAPDFEVFADVVDKAKGY